MNYSVSFTTFNKRLEPFKNIFTKIKSQREDIECTVIINGVLNGTFDEKYRKEIPGYMQRHLLKPGITGLAQIKGYRGETKLLKEMEDRNICFEH